MSSFATATTTTPRAQSAMDPKERFFRYFQHEVTALQDQMTRISTTSPTGGELNDAIDHCLAGIDRLSHEVKDASSYIPAYDQRTYAEAIKALSEKLQGVRASCGGKKKFSFKTAKKNASAISLADAAELAQKRTLGVPGRSGADSANQSSPLGSKEEKSTGVTITNHVGSHIILPSSSTDATRSGTVTNVRHSVIDLSPPTTSGGHPFANLILKNIKDSLIVCGQVTGPIHITKVERSVLVTSSRQFRMHGSNHVDVYLHCSSRPIIEDCENIRFAPISTAHAPKGVSSSENQWDQIDDFKWLKAEPSPHFSVLPESELVSDDVWKNVVPGGHSVSLDDILKAVGLLQGGNLGG
ncbi:tubulin-specific chaperone c [Periconia macrospinosa]|uniref:Tubulin-specific chaperone c n=1 Tax=Periconia macrospinosa TaxID=97972 RepID=A0A2V1EBH3_9PLEO|nr:tubulin-specific chaperone c [Periconia macrospinosa]